MYDILFIGRTSVFVTPLLFSSISMATKKGLTQEGEGYQTKNKHHLREWLYKPDHHLQEHANDKTPSSASRTNKEQTPSSS
jgi:hypothetical protein